MSQPFESTLRYYEANGEEFIRNTLQLDLRASYVPFLSEIPDGGRILDAGCGSGRDSQAFFERGYDVTSIDASSRMVRATTELTGHAAIELRFTDMTFNQEFDGIWACASVLHVPRAGLREVLHRFASALKPKGVCYLSFKHGDGDRNDGGRHFTDMNESSIQELIAEVPGLELDRAWTTGDLSQNAGHKWLNVLVQGNDGSE